MHFPADILTRCWFLAGPTAVGKSEASLILAERLDAEIVSMDSMAVYQGMDIGTAKPSAAEQDRVPHHLIDVADPSEDFSVAEYLQAARSAATEILARGRVPLFVGGTGLYLRSMLRGVFQGPEADWSLRRRLEDQAAEHGGEWLHQRLRDIDPATANRLHANDTRRIIRALEVFEITGRPLSEQHHHGPKPVGQRPGCVFWLEPPREWLQDRINRRVDQMMASGLLQETRQLLQRNPPPGRTARQALGYRELIDHIREGVSLKDAVEQIRTATRQFAKRQHTWFRNLEECRSVPISGSETALQIADQLLSTGTR
ncbi:MAG: tRNA (adenosine(37)-N6)-dimethylallyltransferase MiaA [Planctomycetaceae bacterium]